LASAPTFSRLEHQIDRKDLYRLTTALVDHFMASDQEPPAAMVLDLDHSDEPTHGPQDFAFYNHHSQNHCYLPLFIFAGTSQALLTAYLRPGTRPTGAENAMILVRLLAYLRRHWPHPHILVRGDRHCATPEVMAVIAHRRWTDCVFGLAGNAVLLRQAAPILQEARRLHQHRGGLAQFHRHAPPTSRRLYDELLYGAQSWAQPWRVVLKAEGMSAGDKPRFVVTSLDAPTPQMLYDDLYCARGTCENALKAVKVDRRSARTSGDDLPGQCDASGARLGGLCPAPCLAHADSATHQARAGPALDHHGDPLPNCRADQPVQGSHPPPSAHFLPCQSAPPAGHHVAVRCASAGGHHVVMAQSPSRTRPLPLL
jgi:Transposase DDE domain group 1